MIEQNDSEPGYRVNVTIGPYSLHALTGQYGEHGQGLKFSSGDKARNGQGMPEMLAIGAGAGIAGVLEALRKFRNPWLPEDATLPDVTVEFERITTEVTGLQDPETTEPVEAVDPFDSGPSMSDLDLDQDTGVEL